MNIKAKDIMDRILYDVEEYGVEPRDLTEPDRYMNNLFDTAIECLKESVADEKQKKAITKLEDLVTYLCGEELNKGVAIGIALAEGIHKMLDNPIDTYKQSLPGNDLPKTFNCEIEAFSEAFQSFKEKWEEKQI